MRKSFVLIVALMLALVTGFFVGCTNNDPNVGVGDVDQNTVASIEIRPQFTLVNGIAGEERSQTITAFARNAAGVSVSGVQLSFGIVDPQSYKGTISTAFADSVTDDNGQIVATYSVVLEQDADVVIYAQTGQVRAERTIQIRVRDAGVGNLSVEVERTVLTVPPDQTKNTVVWATLVDDEGLAIPGVLINFSTNPATNGFVDSDTATTNNSGRAQRTFTSIVNQYGTCTIIATVGELVASASIEIRSVAGPEYIWIGADPDEMEAATGEDMTSTITAVVTDTTGVGVPETTVLFELGSLVEGSPIFGSLTAVDTTTNNDGMIQTTFHSRGGFGQEWVIARVVPSNVGEGQTAPGESPETTNMVLKVGDKVAGFDEDTARIMVTVNPLEDQPRSMSISATPDFFNLPPDSTGLSLIRATVRDASRSGIPNLQVEFDADVGTLGQPTMTDSTGVAMVDFYINPAADLPNLDEPQEAHITATIPGTGWTAMATITIIPSASGVGSLTIETDRKFIWADGQGLSYANIVAVLKDEDGQVLSGEEIVFTSSAEHSVVQSPITTDSLGRAMTVFDDNGVPSINPDTGEPDSVLVTAKYNPMNLSSSTRIMIREQNPVNQIGLHVNARQLTANSGDSTATRATCSLADGSPAPAGTQVYFETDNGSFTESVVPITGNSGNAETYYIAGNVVGQASIIAHVKTVTDTVYSNEVVLELISGPPSIITVTVVPIVLYTNDPEAVAQVTATVLDTSGNPVRQGTFVQFTTTLGTITPQAITDGNGDAIALLRPGVESGVAQISATADGGGGPISGNATATFVAGTPNTITLDADPLLIQVQGGGGNNTSTLHATVRDPNGNLVEQATSVVFELINEPAPPQGCTFGPNQQSFVSRTSNGVAVASLNAGTLIGGKLIRAYTWPDSANDPETTVQVILSTVAVVSGPPFQLDIDVNDEGVDAGGGAWAIEVSARVWDIHRNPVADRIPVVFTVEPEIATIDPGFTGNDGMNGSPTPGLAYARMVYNSINTFDDLEIAADVETQEGTISGARQHVLPLQEGDLELNVDPGNWMFQDGNEEAEIRCWVVLNDGHAIEINNAPILFTSNRARFSWRNFRTGNLVEYFPAPTRKLTGVVDEVNNEERGQATVFLVAEEPDIFLDPFTLEVTVQINAQVEGYNDVAADPAFIFFTRHGR